MNTIRRNQPSPLETEYKEQLKQTAKNSRLVNTVQSQKTPGLTEDVVSLSSTATDRGDHPAKLNPSQPVSFSEKQYLTSQFSTYA
jgi:hypothetical protein